MDLPIYTYADGRPVEGRPDPLSPNATAEEFITWMCACNAYRDRATDAANRAFEREFRRALRRGQ